MGARFGLMRAIQMRVGELPVGQYGTWGVYMREGEDVPGCFECEESGEWATRC